MSICTLTHSLTHSLTLTLTYTQTHRHTHTHTHTHTDTHTHTLTRASPFNGLEYWTGILDWNTEVNFLNQARAWFLEIAFVREVSMRVFVSVYPPPGY